MSDKTKLERIVRIIISFVGTIFFFFITVESTHFFIGGIFLILSCMSSFCFWYYLFEVSNDR